MFLFKRKINPPVVFKVIEREPSEMTVDEWRTNELYCGEAQKVLQSVVVQRMLSTLNNSHPRFAFMAQASIEERAVVQARAEGYSMAISDFKALGNYAKPMVMPESEFKEEEIPKELLAEYGART